MTRNAFANSNFRNMNSNQDCLPLLWNSGEALVSSARQQELRKIQDVTWRMITSFNWQSGFDSNLAVKL